MIHRASTIALALALCALGCGSDATGIAVQISPDPILARAARSPGAVQTALYDASWTVTVTELSGTGGTLESLASELRNASLPVNATSGKGGTSLTLATDATLEAFSRTTFQQTATLVPDDAAQPVTVRVSARYRDETGQVFETSTEARVTLP